MKPSAPCIERLLAKVEAELACSARARRYVFAAQRAPGVNPAIRLQGALTTNRRGSKLPGDERSSS
jgi:hypothetical protein